MPPPESGSHSSHSKLATDVKKAVESAAKSKFDQTVVTTVNNNSYQIDASVTGIARDVVKSAIINEATNQLCRKGYMVYLTCESTAPGKANYYMDFNTERGKQRFAVGVSMDTDRATYLVKKVKSFLP